MATTTPKRGTSGGELPYPEGVDPANVPQDMKELAERIDTVLYTGSEKPWTSDINSRVSGPILVRTTAEGLPTTGVVPNTIVFLIS